MIKNPLDPLSLDDIITKSPWIDVRAYGATGDGSTNDTTALQAAFDAVESGDIILIPKGTYNFNGTLTLDVNDCHIICVGMLKYTGTGTAVKIGKTTTTYRITGNIRVYDHNNDWAQNTIGVSIEDIIESNIRIDRAEGFTKGIKLLGDGNGLTYNQFHLGNIWNCKIGISFEIANAGWVNENNFFGGRFAWSAGQASYAGTRHIEIPEGPNNNRFYGPNFEGTLGEIYFNCDGTHNAVHHARYEGPPTIKYIVLGANSSDNVILYGYGLLLLSHVTNNGINNNIFTRTAYRTQNRTVTVGAVAPTTGTWARRDICWNTTPTAGATPGWICVVAGTPGTWKAMSNLLDASYPILGDATAGRVTRGSYIKIDNGTNANTLKCTLVSRWNGDAIAVTDNIAKDATTGDYNLSGSGKTLTIKASGLTGNAIYAISNISNNASGTVLTSEIICISNDIRVFLRDASASTLQDITVLVDTGAIYVEIFYKTDA